MNQEELVAKRRANAYIRNAASQTSCSFNGYTANDLLITCIRTVQVQNANLMDEILTLREEVDTLRKEVIHLESSLDTLNTHSCGCSCVGNCASDSNTDAAGDTGDTEGK